MSNSPLSGHVTWVSETSWRGVFTLPNGLETTYSGNCNKNMNQFQVNEAVASYTSDKDFRGSPEWSGQIGPNTVNLKVGGVTITGKLGSPMTGMSAEGNGNWLTKGHEH